MPQRLDPVTEAEWAKLRAALPAVLAKKSFLTDEERASAEKRVSAILDTLWETGCHPIVLAEPKEHGVTIKGDPGDYSVTWRRPKKRGLAGYCAMPLNDKEAVALSAYLIGPHYSRKTIWQYVAQCSKEAGVQRVTPRTLRHTVGWRIFKSLGPTAAKESLNVSDRVLQYYLAMDSGTRLRAIREQRATKTDGVSK